MTDAMGLRRHHRWFAAGLPAVFLPMLAGCALTVARFDAPVVVFSDSKVVDLSVSTLTAVFAFEVRNPNAYDLPVRQVRYRVRVHGTAVAEGTERSAVDVAAHQSARVELTADLALAALDAASPHAILAGEVPYELEAWLSVGPLLGSHTVYVAADSALRVDLPMETARTSGVAFPYAGWHTYSSDLHWTPLPAGVALRSSEQRPLGQPPGGAGQRVRSNARHGAGHV